MAVSKIMISVQRGNLLSHLVIISPDVVAEFLHDPPKAFTDRASGARVLVQRRERGRIVALRAPHFDFNQCSHRARIILKALLSSPAREGIQAFVKQLLIFRARLHIRRQKFSDVLAGWLVWQRSYERQRDEEFKAH